MNRVKVIHPSGKEIGYVEPVTGESYWRTVCYFAEMGHIGAESEKEAVKDVLQEYDRLLQYQKHRLESHTYFLLAFESEIFSFTNSKGVIVKIEISLPEKQEKI